jgi:hypothetical protein
MCLVSDTDNAKSKYGEPKEQDSNEEAAQVWLDEAECWASDE